jgi:hypothetical protein
LVGLDQQYLNQGMFGPTVTSTANPWGNTTGSQVVYAINGQQVQPTGWNLTLPSVVIGGDYASDYFGFASRQTRYERVLELRAFVASFTPIEDEPFKLRVRTKLHHLKARHGYQMAPRLPCYRGRRTR